METSTLSRRAVLTVAALVVYRLLEYVPLPFFDSHVVRDLGRQGFDAWSWTSVAALGIAPFISGFLLVELASFLIPAGQRLRRDGVEGRRRLNLWAVLFSLVVAAIQGTGIMLAATATTAPSGAPLIEDPSRFTIVMGTVSLVAGSVAVFLIARFISERGVGNGFCLLLVVGWVVMVVNHFRGVAEPQGIPNPESHGAYLVLAVVVAAVYARGRARVRRYETSRTDLESFDVDLPVLPQGIVPVILTLALMGLPAQAGYSGFEASPIGQGAVFLVGLLVFSWICLQLFSNRSRVTAALPENSWLQEDFDGALHDQFLKATLFLSIGAALWEVLQLKLFQPLELPTFLWLVAAFAVVADLEQEWKFRSEHPKIEQLLEMDNVHLASFLSAALRSKDIPCCVRGYSFRSLFFFFAPLFKMSLVVPADQSDAAWNVLEEMGVKSI